MTLGTDGFGRSDNREHLRRHFEVNAESIAGSGAVAAGARRQVRRARAQQAFEDLGVDTEKIDPAIA